MNSGVLNSGNLLLRVAGSVGITGPDMDALKEFLESGKGTRAVLDAVDVVHNFGIHSIPTLVVGGLAMLSGASRTEEVLEALKDYIRGDRSGQGGKRVFADVLDKIEDDET